MAPGDGRRLPISGPGRRRRAPIRDRGKGRRGLRTGAVDRTGAITLAVADRHVRDHLASVDQVSPIALIVAAARVANRQARPMPEDGRDLLEPLAAEKFAASGAGGARGDRSAETTVRGGSRRGKAAGCGHPRRIHRSVPSKGVGAFPRAGSGDGFPSGRGAPGPTSGPLSPPAMRLPPVPPDRVGGPAAMRQHRAASVEKVGVAGPRSPEAYHPKHDR